MIASMKGLQLQNRMWSSNSQLGNDVRTDKTTEEVSCRLRKKAILGIVVIEKKGGKAKKT